MGYFEKIAKMIFGKLGKLGILESISIVKMHLFYKCVKYSQKFLSSYRGFRYSVTTMDRQCFEDICSREIIYAISNLVIA